MMSLKNMVRCLYFSIRMGRPGFQAAAFGGPALCFMLVLIFTPHLVPLALAGLAGLAVTMTFLAGAVAERSLNAPLRRGMDYGEEIDLETVERPGAGNGRTGIRFSRALPAGRRPDA